MANRLWVLDIDGTLMNTEHDYSYPLLDATRLIIDELGEKAPGVSAIIELANAIDRQRVEEVNPLTGRPFVYSKERFPGSLVCLYEQLCEREHLAPREQIREQLLGIGHQAFNEARYTLNIKRDARSFARELSRRGDTIILLTRGDPGVQGMKIRALREAGVVFHDAVIVGQHKSGEFHRLLHDHSWSASFSVGDSYKADILPALHLGYRGFWIPLEHWEQRHQIEELRRLARVDGAVEITELSDIFRYVKE